MVEMGFHKQLRTSAFLDIIVKDCKLLRPESNLCEDWDCLVLHQTINASSILYKVSFVEFFSHNSETCDPGHPCYCSALMMDTGELKLILLMCSF